MKDLRGMYICDKCDSDLYIGYKFLGHTKYVKNKSSEHLLKTCHTCGYQWKEKCADAENEIT